MKNELLKTKTKTHFSKYLSAFAAMLLFFIAFLIGSFLYRGFASLQVFFNFFIDNAFLLVSAAGMTLVILSGGIDLSVGAVVALTTMIVSSLIEIGGFNPFVAMFIALIVGGIIGTLMGLMVAYWKVPPFIATLAGMFFARGSCYIISIQSISIKNQLMQDLAIWKFRFGDVGFISLNVIIAVVAVLLIMFVSIYTKFGRNIYAIGGNEQSAMLLGLPVRKTKILVYTVNGLCSATAGIVFSFYMLSGYGLHCIGMEMDVIASVVIGGTLLSGGIGYVFGTVFGVLTLGIIQTLIMFNGQINSWWTKITIGILLLLFIVLQRVIVTLVAKKSMTN